MVADAELVKSGGEVNRVSGEEISVDAVECAINLHSLINESGRHATVMSDPTHQKGNISIFEEVFMMSYE